MSKRNRVALVTGGGGGIGRAVALSLAADGWAVVVAGRRLDALEETVFLAPDGAISAAPADVRDAGSVERLFSDVLARHGRVDLLFNNAGVNAPKEPLDEVSVDELKAIIEVNILGAILCARSAFGIMKAQDPKGGRIINNGSVSAYAPRPNSAPYTATKHAITGLTKALALDGRADGITCGQIDLGNVATDMQAYMAAGAIQSSGAALSEPQIAPEMVGRTVAFMASLPLEANIPFLTLMAAGMPLFGRG